MLDEKHYYLSAPIQYAPSLTCFDVKKKEIHFYSDQTTVDYRIIRNLIREPVMATFERSSRRDFKPVALVWLVT